GGAALTAGVGYAGLPWIGAMLGLVGVGVAMASARQERGGARAAGQPVEQGA
ncbi:MAG: hypothetical protein JWP92_1478, partial [Caulobacter sp.]|nr:hypothetical protein [Caulobacter sp.]